MNETEEIFILKAEIARIKKVLAIKDHELSLSQAKLTFMKLRISWAVDMANS